VHTRNLVETAPDSQPKETKKKPTHTHKQKNKRSEGKPLQHTKVRIPRQQRAQQSAPYCNLIVSSDSPKRYTHTNTHIKHAFFLFFLPHADLHFSTRSSQGYKILQRTQAKIIRSMQTHKQANGKGLINCLQARRSG
jgi:hypothetical protein